MKKILNASLTCLALLLAACSEPATHISHVNMVNDLGVPVELALCDDYLHCESISRMWPAMNIGVKKTQPITVSNEVKSVFRVTSKNEVRCLRVKLNESAKGYQDVLLSSAQGC
jgi:hypothetical protein